MATRSRIFVITGDELKSIYCHYDGYVAHNGKILKEHYNTLDKVLQLVDGGNLSSLGERTEPDPNKLHNWENKQPGVCVYYGRDRGEEGQEAKVTKLFSTDLKIVLSLHKKEMEEYNYLFMDGRWVYWIEENIEKMREL